MKPILFVLLLAATVARGEQQEIRPQYTEDLNKTAKRVVGNKVYDIRIQSTGWQFATVKFVRPHTYTAGWVVTGRIGDTNGTFILRNPPTQALARFGALKSEYMQIKPRVQQLEGEYQAATNALEMATLEVRRCKANPPSKIGTREESQWIKDIEEATRQQQMADNRSVNLGDQYKRMKARLDYILGQGFDLDGEFNFTCYAVPARQVIEKMQVYDHGKIAN